jgi:hypothetical protein
VASEISSRDRAVQLEDAVCELLQGKRTPGSGSKSQKGDVRSPMFLAEAKYREQICNGTAFVTMDLQWLETIWEHARRDDRHPLLAIEAWDGSRAVVVPLSVYLGLGATVPNTGRVECLRSFCVTYGVFQHLPISVTFTRIEVPETQWVILSWGEMLELRQANQPQPETKSSLSSGSGFPSRPTRWTTPAPWRKRPFR